MACLPSLGGGGGAEFVRNRRGLSRPDAGGAPTTVRVGLYLADLLEISCSHQTVLADVVVQAGWLDPRLQLVNLRGVTAALQQRVEVESRGRVRYRQRFRVEVVSLGYARQGVLFRRIGANELDAIDMCRGHVEAQLEYASQKHDGAQVNQYAQRVISTPGKQDGLAWQAADWTWQGPVGEMNFMVKGVRIGGFALVAAPADYAVTGVKTFIVSYDGIAYEKDLGPKTHDQAVAMDRFNPDPTWKPVTTP